MRRTIATACVLAVISVGVCAQQVTPKSPSTQQAGVVQRKKVSAKKKRSHEAPAPVQQLPPQIMPPIPATLMNSTPVKPSVTMESGLLTIDAPNSTLSDVLNGVHKVTGAAIEGAAPTERVAVRLGPGKPEQVLAALLRGTPYDYVILGALGKQDVVTRVVLTQSSGSAQMARQPAAPSFPRPPESYQPPPVQNEQPEQAVPDDTAVVQPSVEPEPEAAQPQPQPQPQQPDQNQPKTPEQLFRELQLLDQQTQQR